MAIIPLTTFIADGDFAFAQEVEGSPAISTDEVTRAMLIVRSYAVYSSAYVPLPQGTPDVIYSDAYLVNEQPGSIQGPILFFQRVFAQIPVSRTESRIVAFTKPGISDYDISHNTADPIGWNQYGRAAPYTANRVASVVFTYALNPIASVPALTVILYAGAAVDFTGTVFKYVGNVTFTVGADTVTEPSWELAGTTVPASSPSTWVVETNFRRWRGPIFETEVVQVTGV